MVIFLRLVQYTKINNTPAKEDFTYTSSLSPSQYPIKIMYSLNVSSLKILSMCIAMDVIRNH